MPGHSRHMLVWYFAHSTHCSMNERCVCVHADAHERLRLHAQCPMGKTAVNSPPQTRNVFVSAVPVGGETCKPPEAILCPVLHGRFRNLTQKVSPSPHLHPSFPHLPSLTPTVRNVKFCMESVSLVPRCLAQPYK